LDALCAIAAFLPQVQKIRSSPFLPFIINIFKNLGFWNFLFALISVTAKLKRALALGRIVCAALAVALAR
jgi:hypothetical protein